MGDATTDRPARGVPGPPGDPGALSPPGAAAPARPVEVYDDGLQQERTALAWDRTGVAMLVAGVLFVRAGEPPYGALRHAPGFAAIGLGAWLLFHAYRNYEQRHAVLRGGHPITQPSLVRLVGAATVALSLASIVLVLSLA